MLGRIVTVVKLLVRVATALGVTYLTALFTTSLRDDGVGLAVGIGFGLIFGFMFVLIDWAKLQH